MTDLKEIPMNCFYRNNDDGDDTAWCVQTFSNCDDERMEKCVCRMEEIDDKNN